MTEVLMIAAVFTYIAGVFILRYFIGEKIFWGKRYLKQGYKILLSRRFDAYLMDTLAVCFASLLIFMFCLQGKDTISSTDRLTVCVLLACFALLLLCGRLLEKSCVFYHNQGLLLSRPFQPLRSVLWGEIGSIQKRPSAQIYNILDRNGRRLAWFPLTQRTQPFFDLAQKNGVSGCIPKGSKIALNTSGKKLNGTLGDWDAALAQSAYARNKVISFVPFPDFMVVLFMDKQLNENNVIAVNQDGTTRWTISDIIKAPRPIPYAALTQENENTVSVMAVMSRQYDCVIYEIDVYEQRIVRQYTNGGGET